MKNQIFLVLSMFFLFISGYVHAETTQVTTSSPNQNAPTSSLNFSPSIWIGARSNLTGLVTAADKEAHTVGPFIKPGFTIKYTSSPISLMTKYSFETSTAKGFGDANAYKSVSNNTYYQHEPIFLLSGQASESSKLNLFGDLWVNTENKRAQNTFYELTFQPDYEYQVNSNVSLAVGYQFFRKNYFDSTFTAESASPSDFKAAVLKKPGIFAATSTDVVGQSPMTTVHAGILTANVKLGEKSSVLAYFRGGRQVSTILGRTGINYRFNADLSTAITQNLSAQVRYRFHLEDNDTAPSWYYNRVRVIVSYAFSKSWSADIQNQFTLEQKTTPTSQAKYINENYSGVTYKF